MNMHVGDIITEGAEPVDHYSVGVGLTYDGDTYYLNPNDFDLETFLDTGSVNPEDIVELRRQIEERNPDLAATFDEATLEAGVARILSVGPFASPPSEDAAYCTVNRQAEYIDEKQEFFSLGTGIDPEYLAPIPGSEESWDAFIGAHEGDHCENGMRNNTSPHTSSESPEGYQDAYDFNTFLDEIAADRAALKALNENGYDDITDAVRDIRALAAGTGDATHASQLHLENDDPVTFEHFEAARDFPDRMREAYDNEWNDPDGVKFNSGPTEFAEAIRDMLDRGDFDNEPNPYMRDYIEAYVEAYERRVDDPNYSFSRPSSEAPQSENYETDLHAIQQDASLAIEESEPYITAAIPLENSRARYENHPVEIENARSVFQNPDTDPAVLAQLQENYSQEIASLGLNPSLNNNGLGLDVAQPSVIQQLPQLTPINP